MNTRLATSLIALSTAFAAPAMADVTAADVFANQQAFYEAMGITLNGTLENGQLTNPEMNVILPMGIATFQVKTDAVTMTDNSDGSVTVAYPSPMTLTMAGGVQDGGSFDVTLEVTHEGYTVTATGNPGDISYEMDAQNLRMEVLDASIDDPSAEDFQITGFFEIESFKGTSQVTEGNIITYASTTETGASNADFAFEVDNIISTSKQTTSPMQSTVSAALPVGGSDVLNLSAALRNGLNVLIESSGGESTSSSETLLDGAVMTRQETTTGTQVFSLAFNEEGLVATGEADGFNMTFNDQLLFPGDIEFAMETINVVYDIPLNASDEAQDFRIASTLGGVTVGEPAWALFDPAGLLPRDPAEISFDVTGVGTSGIDLLDFAAMSQMFGPPPIQVDEVTLENLRIAAVGAELTAQGAMTFDWTDMQTIPGIARPEGQVTVNLNGANKLMDTLVQMGLIPEEELMMPRMMMGMFTTPVGDDMLQTVLEVNSEGHVLANGQRLQ